MASPSSGRQNPPLTLSFVVGRPPREVFPVLVDRIADGLERLGVLADLRAGGTVHEQGREFGRVTVFRPSEELAVELHPIAWGPSPTMVASVRLETIAEGTLVRIAITGWDAVLEAAGGGQVDWLAGAFLPSALRPLMPDALANWFTDRKARRPMGEESITVYQDPTYHWPNFFLILERISLTPQDRLLEVACGGGAFLRTALESGCSASAVDHSPDMVRTARESNRAAIAAGRLEVLAGDAGRLPVPDSRYTCCVCTGAFNFFPDPAAALAEMHRALAPGGRLAVYVGSAALRGTPATPEPIASKLRYYEPDDLARLANSAGFADVRVESPDMESYARRARVPEESMELFQGTGGSYLLLARKPGTP